MPEPSTFHAWHESPQSAKRGRSRQTGYANIQGGFVGKVHKGDVATQFRIGACDAIQRAR